MPSTCCGWSRSRGERQRVTAAVLDIDPAPVRRREGRDFFENRTTVIEIDAPHNTLTVKLAARIAVDAGRRGRLRRHPAMGERARADDTRATTSVRIRRCISSIRAVWCRSIPKSATMSGESFPPGRPILAGAAEVMRRIKHDFTYEVGATTVTTTPSMSFALRRGVCQDFAHIMISGLRGLGIPAAYVSGYLRTVPRPGSARLEGADAMHAWVMVWCGSAGWWGLDPTNALIASDDHVVLAIGRDYADAAPIGGVVLGSGQQQLSTAVDVIPMEG